MKTGAAHRELAAKPEASSGQNRPGEPILQAEHISKSYGSRTVLNDVSLTVRAGEWVGIIGPNGSGKSTLLSLLSGADSPAGGRIELKGRTLRSYTRKSLSQTMAVLLQESLPPIGYTVREVVEMGRFPYQSWFGSEAEDSGPYIDSIMERLQLTELEERPIDRLSGGQRQRVALAKLMAQSPSIVLLDEPTTYLDIRYQVQFMDVVRDWQQDCGLTVVSVLHDLNLAALYCDRLVVVHEGRIAADGTPEEMMSPDVIARYFDTRAAIVPHPGNGRPQLLMCPAHTDAEQKAGTEAQKEEEARTEDDEAARA
ncbi:ABC transporter ATP-binding protein [Paenibacillus thiaminolyticus]|uniref:ABC transporter ATP-binding protein n=1 Tax=Paenibacillus thiaminolyticus TaxID=49283 RepID=UPI00235019FD|nr:ABC transporter ATP-binding protein [Paenibacillus thiaminolyticus]WCR26785.1 ABC transporter ATP-binding protein [Paenibacillus thiaminolyticus]